MRSTLPALALLVACSSDPPPEPDAAELDSPPGDATDEFAAPPPEATCGEPDAERMVRCYIPKSGASTCTTLVSDPYNCGGCNVRCFGSTPVCGGGQCVAAPDGGADGGDAAPDGGATTGPDACVPPDAGGRVALCRDVSRGLMTCADLERDPYNCGGCNVRCTAPMERCVGGRCVAAPDASADAADVPADAAPVSGDAIAVADAAADAPRDIAPDRYSCGEGVPPRCASHLDCAICLPTATGTAWCCNPANGFCRATIDRTTCE